MITPAARSTVTSEEVQMDPRRELLRIVHNHFLETAEWPEIRPLQLQFRRQLGYVPKLAAEIGRDIIICDDSERGECRLTLRGVAQLDGANPDSDIAHFLFAVRALAAHYVANGAVNVSVADLVADLHLSDLQIRRVGELMHIAPSLWTGFGKGEGGIPSLTPYSQVWYYEDVDSVEAYYEALNRASDDQRAAHQLQPTGYTPPPRSKGASRFGWSGASTTVMQYVDPTRLDELRALTPTTFDLRRLIALCEELNLCAQNQCLHATAMLTRAIIDHVPPIFKEKSFAGVANNYSGTKSFKISMRHLEQSARSIADGHLHSHIRNKEVLPTVTQVDFSRDLDVLLAEIVRLLT